MNILHLSLEFSLFYSAKKLSYSTGIGLVDGFDGNKINHLTVPIMYHEQFLTPKLKELVGDQKFDQIWLEVVHTKLPEHLLEWLSSLAPIRVGFIIEPLIITPGEFESNQVGTQRRVDNFKQKLPYLTHAMVIDERDLAKLNIPSMLCIPSVPSNLIKVPNSTSDKAVFHGTDYGERGEWLKQLGNRLNVNPPSSEDDSNLPRMFEQLFIHTDYLLTEYDDFYKNWYYIRQGMCATWINHLHTMSGCGIVNLPNRSPFFPGRVIEGMAAGKPVVSPLLDNDLFIDSKEILYYKDVDGLIECINKLQTDPDLRWSIAEAARANILENHTTEVRVRQILDFVGK